MSNPTSRDDHSQATPVQKTTNLADSGGQSNGKPAEATQSAILDLGSQPDLARELIIAEYNGLTAELNNRQNIRYQMIQFSVVALGALLTVSSVGIQNHLDSLIFAYPVLVLVLAIIYVSNAIEGRRIKAYIKAYIKTKIEVCMPEVGGEQLGWQRHRKHDRIERFGSVGNIGAKIVFIATAAFATLIGIQIMHQSAVSAILLRVAIGSTVLLTALLFAEGALYERARRRKLVERSMKTGQAESQAKMDRVASS